MCTFKLSYICNDTVTHLISIYTINRKQVFYPHFYLICRYGSLRLILSNVHPSIYLTFNKRLLLATCELDRNDHLND